MICKLLENRQLCLALILGSAGYFITHLLGLNLLNCPIPALFHRPCPGCGLTRAVEQLAHGNWLKSLHYHALAIPFLLLFTLIFLAAILPSSLRDKLVSGIKKSENKTHWPIILAASTLIYGLTRFLFFPNN